MWTVISYLFVFVAGGVVVFFVLKNNPKLLNIEKLTQKQLQDLQAKIKAKLG